MKCPYCGTTLPDDAAFCASCGKRVADEQASQHSEPEPLAAPFGNGNDAAAPAHNAPATGNAAASPFAPSPSTNGFQTQAAQFLSTKRGKGIVAGMVAAVVAIVVAAFVGFNMANNVPDDMVRQALQNSSTMASGIASNDYVEASPYSLDGFKIDKQADEAAGELGKAVVGSDKVRHVYFSGAMKNDFFKTDFTGEAYYVKQGDTWMNLTGPSITSSTTTPLKGVASMADATTDENCQISNFASTLDSNNGSYTSTATQDVTYSFWFATDTATNTRTFVFDGSRWKPTADAQVSNMQTKTNLTGKKFEYQETYSSLFRSGNTTSAIEFTSDGNDGAVSATYTLNWKYSGDTSEGSSGQYYLPVNLSGNLEGTVDHTFGEDDFDIELNDSANQVTFTGSESYSTVSAGNGQANTMQLSANTNTKSFESPFQTTMYRMTMGTYVEKA